MQYKFKGVRRSTVKSGHKGPPVKVKNSQPNGQPQKSPADILYPPVGNPSIVGQ